MTDRRSLPSILRLALCALALAVAAGCDQPAGDKPGAPAGPAADPIKATASGLKYEVLASGKGDRHPAMGDKVKVHYTGWLTDGTKFDSSRDRGAPAEFTIGEVIRGWNEALVLMVPGDRWKLTIPADLAYGDSGRPGIPPKSTLVFDVELLDFQSAPKMPPFRAGDPASQKTTASGLKYEALCAGTGDPPAADNVVELRFAFWTPKGDLIDCTERSGGTVKARLAELTLAFMKEGIPLLHPGERIRFEVPPGLCFGAQSPDPRIPANSTTVWELELVRIIKPLPVPPFALPDDAKLTTTASGLKYEVIEPGEGTPPKASDRVKVHYAGWLSDGTPFDSSFGRGEEAEMGMNQVIPGWREGLGLMKPGAVYRFVIPPSLAYGAHAPPGSKIPPNATLVFYVKLVKVLSGDAN